MSEKTESLVVSIWCLTYNHEPYIRQCLEGFIMQETNFRFEAIVHDDASTDGTALIIREYAEKYPDIIKPIYEKENQYSKHDGTLDRIMYASCKGKYIAMCEGDDYWIDKDKLQIQVDYLEEHEECGLVHTLAVARENEMSKSYQIRGGRIDSFSELLITNKIITLTVCIRESVYEEYLEDYNSWQERKDWKMGDYPMWLWISKFYEVHFINKVTGVYRVLNESASHSKSIEKILSFIDSSYQIQLFFANKYGESTNVKSELDSNYRKSRIHVFCKNGLYKRALFEIPLLKQKDWAKYILRIILSCVLGR